MYGLTSRAAALAPATQQPSDTLRLFDLIPAPRFTLDGFHGADVKGAIDRHEARHLPAAHLQLWSVHLVLHMQIHSTATLGALPIDLAPLIGPYHDEAPTRAP